MTARFPDFFRKLLFGFSPDGRIVRYVMMLSIGAVAIAALILAAAVLTPKSYTSGFTLILPGAGQSTSVSLDSLGQASSSGASPFGDHTLSPTENYKKLFQSYRLRGKVAKRLGLSLSDAPAPDIRLANQTKLMYLSVKAGSAQEARAFADAWLDVFLEETNALRQEEQDLRESAYHDTLKQFEASVHQTQVRIIEFQQEHGLISIEQFGDLVRRSEILRIEAEAAETQERAAASELSRLAALVGLSPETAAKIMILQSDPVYLSLRADLSEVETRIAGFEHMFGQNHPDMRSAREEQSGLLDSLMTRGARLVGMDIYAGLADSERIAGADRAQMVRRLVEAAALASSAAERTRSLQQQRLDTDARVTDLAGPATDLAALLRDHKVAETVFASALARIDANRTDIFASYPLTQTVEFPDTPTEPSSLSLKFLVIGGIAGFIFYSIGLALLWIRLPLIRALLKII